MNCGLCERLLCDISPPLTEFRNPYPTNRVFVDRLVLESVFVDYYSCTLTKTTPFCESKSVLFWVRSGHSAGYARLLRVSFAHWLSFSGTFH